MDQAPAWLSYASPAIAMLSLLVSGATYRRQAVRLRCEGYLVRDFKVNFSLAKPDQEGVPGYDRLAIIIVVNNRSSTAIEVSGFRLYHPKFGNYKRRIREKGPADASLAGHSSGRWEFAIENVPLKTGEATDPNLVYEAVKAANLLVDLGNGKTKTRSLRDRVQTYRSEFDD